MTIQPRGCQRALYNALFLGALFLGALLVHGATETIADVRVLDDDWALNVKSGDVKGGGYNWWVGHDLC